MSVDVKYKTKATATGGRDGSAKSEDSDLSVKLAVPKEMGGNGGGNNPEQLFAMGYSACFLGAMKFVSSQDDSLPKVPDDATVSATVGIGPRDAGGFGITTELEISMPGVDKAETETLVKKAHEVCPYSNATRNNVDVKLTVV